MTKRIGLAAVALAVMSLVAYEAWASEPGSMRDAKAKGVRVREVPPSDTLVTRQYKVTVAPTVLILNPDGTEKARHEGESEEIHAAIKAALARLGPGGA